MILSNLDIHSALITQLAEGPRFQEEEARIVLYKCNTDMAKISKNPTQLEQKHLTELVLTEAHAASILNPTTGLCSRYIEQTRNAYVGFYNNKLKKPAQVVKEVTIIFDSLDNDYVTKDAETAKRIQKLNFLELARRHALDFLKEKESHLPELARKCRNCYQRFDQTFKEFQEDSIPSPPRSSITEESPSGVASLYRKMIS